MKPAAPATSSLIGTPARAASRRHSLRPALGEVAGETVLPGGELDRVRSLADQSGERGPRRRAPEHVGGRREDLHLAARLLEDLAREFVPGALAGGGHMVYAVGAAVDQPHKPIGEVPGVG